MRASRSASWMPGLLLVPEQLRNACRFLLTRPLLTPLCRNREGETDMYFSGLATHAPQLRMLRTAAGGELYIAVGHEV